MNTEIDDDAPPSRRGRWLAAAALVLTLALGVVWWPGCRQYPPATSREAMAQMKLLYAACSARDPARLARVEAGTAELARLGKLSAAEQEAFAGILADARAGDWPRAQAASLRFAQDQVK